MPESTFPVAPGTDIEQILPEGLDPPDEIPSEIFKAASRIHLEPRRLDMQALAGQLGMGRTTLYRRVGDRDRLLGEVLWHFARRYLIDGIEATRELRGRERIVRFAEALVVSLDGLPAHRRLLEEEPAAALRILTTPTGIVQSGMRRTLARLLDFEAARGAYRTRMESDWLAYAILRLAESFVYADLIVADDINVEQAVALIDAVLVGVEDPTSAPTA